jgi:hypothetical protein
MCASAAGITGSRRHLRFGESCAQRLLVDLPKAGAGDRGNELEAIGHPPMWYFGGEVPSQLIDTR